jgi:2-dehydropantoate 2-reductase
MKYVVVGAGGVGGYFGARLAADGNEVAFLARGAHAEAMRRDGLTVKSPLGDLHIDKPDVPASLADIGFADVVLFCVKLWDIDAAAAQIKPLLAHDTAVIPVQNGVTACDRLAELIGPRHVMGGVARISAVIESPGVIRHNAPLAQLIFGERDGAASWRQDAISAACQSAGIEHTVSKAIDRNIWEKFVFLAPVAGAACFYRMPVGEIVADEDRRALLAALMRETAAVGRAAGVALDDGLVERALAQAAAFPPAAKPSMLVDLERGRRLELDWLTGQVVRLGRERDVATPASAKVYEALRPYANGAPDAA